MAIFQGTYYLFQNTCPMSDGLNSGLGPLLSGLSSILILSNSPQAEGYISFISVASSYAWYMKLSQFETVFLGLAMLQICVLRYLEILPMNVNNFFLGDPSGRKRKRRSFKRPREFNCDQDIFIRSLFKVLSKLDDGNCLARTVCELAISSRDKNFIELPRETFDLLEALKLSAKSRMKAFIRDKSVQHHGSLNNDSRQYDDIALFQISDCRALDGLQKYEEAVNIGMSVKYANETLCDDRYSSCPLTKEDIKEYIGILDAANFL